MIHLFVNYYKDKNWNRQIELNQSILANLRNSLISKVYIVANNDIPEIISGSLFFKRKATVIYHDSIPTYDFLFDFANLVNNGEEISIISNLDIVFDNTLNRIVNYKFNNNNECIALTRDDMRNSKRNDTQDVWIFKGYIKAINNCDFTMGIAGCDNSIAYCISNAGYKLRNPAFTINAIHNHKSGVRNYIKNKEIKTIDSNKYPYKLIDIENYL